MKPFPLAKLWIPGLLAVGLLASAVAAGETAADAPIKRILDAIGVSGGMVVHLGCGDGKLTADLHAGDAYTVHGLDADPANVAQARNHVRSLGIYGPVSIEQFSGSVLPYTDNLINLVVVQDAGNVPRAEVMRVLAPEGVACIETDGEWERIVKPRPDNIDDWGHFLHGAGNNAVADDTVVGAPRSLQWIAPPLWLRSHETPSGIQSPVTSGGRLFYFFDEGLIGITDERLPDRWSLICRDAFNGKLLWKRPLGAWGWREWAYERFAGKDWTALRSARLNVPADNQRRLVACGNRLYVTLAHASCMSIMDARTGHVMATVEETQGASEILVSQGIAVVYTRQIAEDVARRRGIENRGDVALVAVDADSGKVLWRHPCNPIRPLALAVDNGRVIYLAGKNLVALDLKSGRPLWQAPRKWAAPKTLVAIDDVIVMQGGKRIAVFDATDGQPLWEKTVGQIGGAEGDDLFVVDGLVWRGIACVDDNGKQVKKSANALAIGWDLRSGEEKKRVLVNGLRSPEHHHRCYRNRATTRYLISSFEGAEYLNFQDVEHFPNNNWLRGACRHGMIPANGLLYVPADQCFCQPGGKLLGYAAVKSGPDAALEGVPDDRRLEKGPAFGKLTDRELSTNDPFDWPTFRHDAARSGSTAAQVSPGVAVDWKVKLGGPLTAPVAAGGKVFVAQRDAHTVHALDMDSGKVSWEFTAGGRIDSPPTIHKGMVLFGSADGRVYCLRASDGQLVWRFLAAPTDRRVGYFDQIESAWPVHGSVLVDAGVAYFTAGRSTYLDGGIRVYGLDPATGKILHQGLLEGPHRRVGGEQSRAFFIEGANSDVLVSEGGFLYMRQKKMTPELEEVDVEILSSKGAQDVGLHLFSTSGLLDDSGYNRVFWMYSKRWPGFQLANQAPKTGQLLVVDDEKTYAVRMFYRRNAHSLMFFPGKEGFLLFADENSNEPQIVGEEGSVEPIKWLPQSDYSRGRGDEMRALESEAFGWDKMVGYTRAKPPVWAEWLSVRIRAMVKAGDTLFVAGPPDVFDEQDPYASFEDRAGARLVAVAAGDGKKLFETELDFPPVFDGIIAADGRLFASLRDGSLVCLAAKK
jgi:outer membrane protein assembly factor BamB